MISSLLPLIITINGTRSPLGVAVDEISSIQVLQDDGSSIFATAGGHPDHITIKWTISSTYLPDDVTYTGECCQLVVSFTDLSLLKDLDAIQFTFPTRGSYQLVANVSNQVSMDQASIEVQAERLIGDITLTKTNKFSHVAAVHEKVVIEVRLSYDHLSPLLNWSLTGYSNRWKWNPISVEGFWGSKRDSRWISSLRVHLYTSEDLSDPIDRVQCHWE